MNNVANEILTFVRRHPHCTDAEIAVGIDRPTPSVRRTRLQLERQEELYNSGGCGGPYSPLMWKAWEGWSGRRS